MGFLDSIIGIEQKKPEAPASDKKSTNPFAISLSFTPLRLSAMRKNSVDLVIRVKNISPETHIVSVDAHLPKNAMLGFDDSCINKGAEKRVGDLASGASVDVPFRIYANTQTKSDNYGVLVTVYSHYIGFDKVLSYAKKSTLLRAV